MVCKSIPFDAKKSTSELQQSSENIKDLSKIMPKNERKTISYSVQPIPNLSTEEFEKAQRIFKKLNSEAE